MKWLLYPVLFLLRLLSHLPLSWLYALGDIISFSLQYVFLYRNKVISQNLVRAFPEKSQTEIRKIKRAFYRNLGEWFAEGIKLISISPKNLLKRIQPDEGNHFQELNGNAIVLMGHTGNWEWASPAVGIAEDFKIHAVYKPIKHELVNQFIIKVRARFGAQLVARKQVPRHFLSANSAEKRLAVFIADQSPFIMNKVEWVDFFNTPTPFLTGYHAIAQRLIEPVYFAYVHRLKRGHYSVRTISICEKGEEISRSELCTRFANALESVIKEQPHNWLWSHKRWKRIHLRP